jgi:hypothetical protein
MNEEAFYRECAAILGAEDLYEPRHLLKLKRTRWNNRAPGNGRFPGFGTIRMFGPGHIHIALRQPEVVNPVCGSPEEVLDLLRQVRERSGR